MNILTVKKYTMKGTTVLSLIFLLLALFNPVDYTAQRDARKREYYPATVIDKYSYSSCSKSSCSNNHYVRIELDNGWWDDVHVSEQTYTSTYVGGTIRFERHITDPVVVKQMGLGYIWLMLAIVVWPIGWRFKEWVVSKIAKAKRKVSIQAALDAHDKAMRE